MGLAANGRAAQAAGMHTTEAHQRLDQFRQEVYRAVLGHRKDSLFELLAAVLTSAGRMPLVRLSLAGAFRRCWSRIPDALAAGHVAVAARPTLLPPHLPAAQVGDRPLWAVAGTIWPRPAARTSPERTYGRQPMAARADAVLVPSWEYQWVVARPAQGGRWVLPLEVSRRGPAAPPPTDLAIRQGAAAHRLSGAPLPPPPSVSRTGAVSGTPPAADPRPSLPHPSPRHARPAGSRSPRPRRHTWDGHGPSVARAAPPGRP